MRRLLLTLLLVILPGVHVAHAQSADREMSEMPVYVFYCDEDPGRIQAGGGKEPMPQELLESGQCTAAEGVAVTFLTVDETFDFEKDNPDRIDWDVEEHSWFARCDIDAEGFCALNSPVGIDILLGVVLHEGTVRPGYEPAFFQRITHNFTEFAGWGLALIPSDGAPTPAAEVSDHQTLALNIVHNDAPGVVLTEWDINDKSEDLYLATNSEGWVSHIVAANDVVEIDLVTIADRADVSVVCAANDDAAVEVTAMVDGDDLTIRVPDTTSDLRCDVIIAD